MVSIKMNTAPISPRITFSEKESDGAGAVAPAIEAGAAGVATACVAMVGITTACVSTIGVATACVNTIDAATACVSMVGAATACVTTVGAGATGVVATGGAVWVLAIECE
jgi:hypothetical protein